MTPYLRCIAGFVLVCLAAATVPAGAQTDQASLLLDLKKARAAYEVARQKLDNDTSLFQNNAISEDDFNRSKNELLSS